MSQNSKATASADGDREIVNTRVFDAGPERVFEAFADPGQLTAWWGPNGFTNTFNEFDLRPGGRWRSVMHGPDGSDYPNENVFLEVERPGRVVFEHPDRDHHFTMTMTFADCAGKTELTWRMRFTSLAEATRLREFLSTANEENFDRLARHLFSDLSR